MTTQQSTAKTFEIAKETTKGKDSCSGCIQNYCCVGQQRIEVSASEFAAIKYRITPKVLARAKIAIVKIDKGANLYDCPFNDPKTGLCDIYNERFFICAQYLVMSPKEHCNTAVGNHGTKVLNPMAFIKTAASSKDNDQYMMFMMNLTRKKPTNMIDFFRDL